MRRHRVGMVVSHELDSARSIFEISRRFYVHNRRPTLTPMLRSIGPRNLHFDSSVSSTKKNGLNSQLVVETANDLEAGRSMEINYLHLSEVDYYRDPETLLTGLLQCVNDTNPDTMIVFESTGNGVGSYFYGMVMAAQNGESDYVLVFLPWFIDDRYTMTAPPDFKATQDEEKTRCVYQWEGKKVRLTDDQLFWRRKKIANSFKGDENRFKQEFPGSIQECFIFSGRARFNHEKLLEIEQQRTKELVKGFLHETISMKKKMIFSIEANKKGYVTFYQYPERGCQYVIFFDVAEGIEVSSGKTDFSSGDVLRCDTLEQVAHWHGKIVPENLADEIIKLARYYNNAFVGAEKNSVGYGVVSDLKKNYGNLYVKVKHDSRKNESTREFGWRTTAATKPLMIKDLSEFITDVEIKINNPGTLEELRIFSIHPDGKLAAPNGQHDDRVISLAGAVQMYLASYSKPDDEYDDDEEDEED